jgi:AcrR family transcriptional regulator
VNSSPVNHEPSAPKAGSPCQHSSGRARPLPPDERRAALVDATLPLVAQYGTKVTTRQIAEAAGVAEGTIFRVFPDKDSLIQAAVTKALDTAPMLAELAGVDAALPLRERLTQVTGIVQHRLISVINLMMAIGMHAPPEHREEYRATARPTNERIHEMILGLLEPDRAQFLVTPQEVARLLRMFTFAGSHPLITEGNPLTPEEIVSVLLDGVRHRHPDQS